MKVNLGDRTVLVHFETRSHKAQREDITRELADVTCVIRTEDKEKIVSRKASQHYGDKCNFVFGRKLAFTRATLAISGKEFGVNLFNKKERTALWEEYKNRCRYKTPNIG